MNVAIIGYARDGRAALTYWQQSGATVTVCDYNLGVAVPEGVATQLGPDYLKNLDRFDIIVRSSGISPEKLIAENPSIKPKITTGINEFMRVCPTKNIIGVTGTKGKGTTSTLITKMLEAAGKTVFFGGNVGWSPLEFLHKVTPESWVVLELSSFQLYDIQYSPHIGVCLMMAPEHLNWHGGFEEYIAAKKNLFAHQKPHDIAIYFADNDISHTIASTSPGAKVAYFAEPGAYVQDDKIVIDTTVLCAAAELRLLGVHNQQNACAAATATWQVVQDAAAIRSVLTTFTGLPHRLEFVREHQAVRYYNDSFASAPPATAAALQAIPGKKVVIIGGYDRHLPLDELVGHILKAAPDIRSLLLIGEATERVANALDIAGFTNYHASAALTMPEVLAAANALAHKGDAVVLSPGFPSFDMFKDFEDRGNQFVKAVGAL